MKKLSTLALFAALAGFGISPVLAQSTSTSDGARAEAGRHAHGEIDRMFQGSRRQGPARQGAQEIPLGVQARQDGQHG